MTAFLVAAVIATPLAASATLRAWVVRTRATHSRRYPRGDFEAGPNGAGLLFKVDGTTGAEPATFGL